MLELARDERRADEHRHERGKQVEPGQRACQKPVGLRERSLDLVAVGELWVREARRHASD
jgi:hypothetical protein